LGRLNLRQLALLVRELLSERLSDLRPSGNPNALLGRNILDKVLQRLEATRTTDDAAVQTDRHHLRRTCLTLLIQNIESVLDVIVESAGVAETRSRGEEFEIIAVITVRNHQAALGVRAVPLLRQIDPVWDIVCVCVTCPEELFAHFLVDGWDECSALGRGSAVVPSLRGVAGEFLESGDSVADVLLLGLWREVLVVDPAVCVRGDVVAFFDATGDDFGLFFASGADGVEGKFHFVVVEEFEEAPPAAARAVFKLGLAAVAALVDVGFGRVFT
jgi:hypothetical protein